MEKETFIYSVDNIFTLMCNSWGSAPQVLEQVQKMGYEEEALELINMVIGDGISETKLNDYIWFDGLETDLKVYYDLELY